MQEQPGIATVFLWCVGFLVVASAATSAAAPAWNPRTLSTVRPGGRGGDEGRPTRAVHNTPMDFDTRDD